MIADQANLQRDDAYPGFDRQWIEIHRWIIILTTSNSRISSDQAFDGLKAPCEQHIEGPTPRSATWEEIKDFDNK